MSGEVWVYQYDSKENALIDQYTLAQSDIQASVEYSMGFNF